MLHGKMVPLWLYGLPWLLLPLVALLFLCGGGLLWPLWRLGEWYVREQEGGSRAVLHVIRTYTYCCGVCGECVWGGSNSSPLPVARRIQLGEQVRTVPPEHAAARRRIRRASSALCLHCHSLTPHPCSLLVMRAFPPPFAQLARRFSRMVATTDQHMEQPEKHTAGNGKGKGGKEEGGLWERHAQLRGWLQSSQR